MNATNSSDNDQVSFQRSISGDWLKATATAVMMLLVIACSTTADSFAQSTDSGAAADADSYRISPEDVLSISVWREPELQREIVVRPDGGFSFPLLGNVSAAGKTTSELEADITAGIAEYVPNAVVTVSVTEINGLKIFVTGQVKKPGQFLVGRYVDVLQALTLAGGVTPFADRRNIRILRRSIDGEKVFSFDYQAVQRGKKLEQNILLKPGDTVVVP